MICTSVGFISRSYFNLKSSALNLLELKILVYTVRKMGTRESSGPLNLWNNFKNNFVNMFSVFHCVQRTSACVLCDFMSNFLFYRLCPYMLRRRSSDMHLRKSIQGWTHDLKMYTSLGKWPIKQRQRKMFLSSFVKLLQA